MLEAGSFDLKRPDHTAGFVGYDASNFDNIARALKQYNFRSGFSGTAFWSIGLASIPFG